MRLELWMILITGAVLFHMYTDGKYVKNIMAYKKQMKMAGVVFGAFVLYILLKKNPANAENILRTSNEYLKYMPIDKNTSSVLSPILDFTSKRNYNGTNNHPIVRVPNELHDQPQTMRLIGLYTHHISNFDVMLRIFSLFH